MYFLELIKKEYADKDVVMFVDMDGVVTDFDLTIDKKLEFHDKRPIMTNINTLKEINELDNVELHILSICRQNYQIQDKNKWLDKYAPFFEEENRMIFSKEIHKDMYSKDLKLNYLKEYIANHPDKTVIHIDDDNAIAKHIQASLKDKIKVYQDSSMID